MSADGGFPAVVFDHDGTLVDSLPMVVAASNRVRETCGQAPADPAAIIDGMVFPTAERMGRLCGVDDPDQREALAVAFYDAARAERHRCRAYAGIAGLLAHLASHGRRLAMVTNNRGDLARPILATLGLLERFAVVLGEEEVAATKPAGDGLRQACAGLGVAPDQACYVGDSRVDVAAAVAAGMAVIGVTWGTHDRHSLVAAGCPAIADDAGTLADLLSRPLSARP